MVVVMNMFISVLDNYMYVNYLQHTEYVPSKFPC